MRLRDYDIEDDSFYLFACAELKTREAEFLDKSRIDRMLRGGGLDEFIRVLRDTVYSGYTGEIESQASFEPVINGEYKKIAGFLAGRLKSGHEPAGELLFFEENLHNIKTVVKSIITDTDLESLHIPVYHSYGKLRNAIETGRHEDMSRPFSATLEFAEGAIKRQKDIRVLEFEIEKFYLNEIFGSVKKINSRFIMDYLKSVIDILNIKNIYRSKHIKGDLDFGYFLHDNGFLPVEFMMKFKDESPDFFIKKIEQSPYADIAIKGAHILSSQDSFATFEKEEIIFYSDMFEPLKYTVSNVEKVFQFFLRKKIELKNLNIIFTGSLYGINFEKIKSRIEV